VQHGGGLYVGELPIERLRRRDVQRRHQERSGDRRRLRRCDVPEVPRWLELQLRERLHDERLLPELLLRAEELYDTGPVLWIRD
jgi:hypothetical protein